MAENIIRAPRPAVLCEVELMQMSIPAKTVRAVSFLASMSNTLLAHHEDVFYKRHKTLKTRLRERVGIEEELKYLDVHFQLR